MLVGERNAPKGNVRERVAAALLRLRRDDRGVTAVVLALTLSVLIGLAGLGAETGLWYTVKRLNQSAADVAALSGAFEKLANQPYSDMCGFAKRDAARNGFVFASYTCPVSTPACTSPASGQMCANNPPVLGASAGNANAFEVILAQDQNSLLASLYLPSVTIGTRAVALISKLDDACLLSLNPTASQAILIQGNSTINMPNCSIVADSTASDAIKFVGSAPTVIADTLRSAGGVDKTGGSSPTIILNTPAQTNAPVVPDPYASGTDHTISVGGTTINLINGPPAMPTTPGTCTGPNFVGPCVISGNTLKNYPTSFTLTGPIQISGDWQIKGQTVDLLPGTYWINNGDLQIGPGGGGSVLECTTCNGGSLGVTIIFTGSSKIGTVLMQSNSAINHLNAPNTGTFAGLLFVQDTVASVTNYTTSGTLQGGSSVALVADGLIYFPHTSLDFQGNPSLGTNGCLVVVADQIHVVGNSTLSTTGCPAGGLGTTPTVKTVALAE